jgi:hypothetical protein
VKGGIPMLRASGLDRFRAAPRLLRPAVQRLAVVKA